MIARRLGRHDARCDINTGIAQSGKALPRNPWIMIVQRCHNPCNSRRNQRIGTGKESNYLIRVNRQPVSADQVLVEGDRVSITPTKIEGAVS